MKGSKKAFLKSATDKKLHRTNRILKALILIMAGMVIYNSYRHATPLYYILFFFAGTMLSVVYNYIYHAEREGNQIKLTSNRWNIVMTVLLILLRFFGAIPILESLEVTWIYDAVYLFFIGLNFKKLKIMIKQLDEVVYKELLRLKMTKG